MNSLFKSLFGRVLTLRWRRQVEDRLWTICMIGLCRLVGVVVAFLSLVIGDVIVLR